MNRIAPPHDDPDWNRMEVERMQLRKRLEAAAEQHKKLAAEIREREATLPPSELLRSLESATRHDSLPSRTEERDLRRRQRTGLVVAVAFISAAAALVWWGLEILKGG